MAEEDELLIQLSKDCMRHWNRTLPSRQFLQSPTTETALQDIREKRMIYQWKGIGCIGLSALCFYTALQRRHSQIQVIGYMWATIFLTHVMTRYEKKRMDCVLMERRIKEGLYQKKT